jgi:DNA-binding XRE family transcriptional regulator/membrane protein YdbS with pleckstrin-like domain
MDPENENFDNYTGTIEPVMAKKECIKALILSTIIWVFFGGMAHLIAWGIMSEEEFPNEPRVYLIIWAITIGTILLTGFLNYWYSKVYVSKFSYEITPKFIMIKSGVFTRDRTTIPFSRVQNITISQGILDRVFGLFTVKIETAGASGVGAQGGTHRAEGLIPALKDPSKIEALINKQIHGYTQAPFTEEKLKGKVFDAPEIAFDEFMAYFLSKLVEGENLRTKIKELREKQNISQGELAEKIGVSRQTINYIENGKIIPSLKIARQIAKVFQVSTDNIFEFDDEEL